MLHTITLTLPNQSPRTVGTVEADTPEAAAARVVQRFPFLPPTYVWVDARALASLCRPVAPPRHDPLTEGQRAYRERIARQRRAERWRQHWIDKDEAKKQKQKQG